MGVRRLFSVLLLIISIISVYGIRVADPDLFGHLLYGHFFLEQGTIHVADPFAYTTQGLTWYAHEYLAQIILWLSYSHLGPIGLIALKCVVGGGSLYFLYRSVRVVAEDVRIWAPAMILASCLFIQFFLFRPQLFTYLGMTLFCFVLLRYIYGEESVSVWGLPLMTLLWANLHGGVLAGIGLIGIVLGLRVIQSIQLWGPQIARVWKEARELIATLVVCLIASLFTPLGWRLWSFLFIELSNSYNARYIEEWRPIRLAELGWSSTLALLLLGLILIAWAAARQQSVAGLKPWHWVLSVVPVAWLASHSVRHIPLLTIWGIPVLALLAQTGWERFQHRRAARVFVVICTGMILVPAFIAVLLTLADPLPRIRLTEQSTGTAHPFGVVSYIRSHGLCGNLYNPLWWGSYLSWELYPNILVSMDGRNDTVFPVEMVGENLVFYAGDSESVDVPTRYDTDMLVVPANSEVLVCVLATDEWSVLFEDQGAVLLLPADVDYESVMGQCSYPDETEAQLGPPQFFR